MEGIQVIEWRDVTGEELVHRWPEEGPGTVSLGAQLTVRESQAGVFFRDGQSLDVLGPGRHTLTALNLPLVQSLINIPFGGTTPFQAEVYFVNMRIATNLKWGTPQPVIFRDKELDFVRLRAFGLYTMRVQDPQLFVNMVVGTEHVYTNQQANDWLRDFIVGRFNDVLGETIDTILDLPAYYNEIGVAVKSRVGEDFTRYGLELIDFVIQAVTPPEEVTEMIDQRAAMRGVGDMRTFLQYRTAQAIGDMPGAGGEGGLTGSMAGMGAGLGGGMAMAGAMMQAMQGALAPQPGAAAQPAPAGPQPTCSECQQPVAPGAKFCPNCGANLQGATCPECGAAAPTDAKFCPECGHALGEQGGEQ